MSCSEPSFPSVADSGEMYYVKPYHSFNNMNLKTAEDMYYVKQITKANTKADVSKI